MTKNIMEVFTYFSICRSNLAKFNTTISAEYIEDKNSGVKLLILQHWTFGRYAVLTLCRPLSSSIENTLRLELNHH